MKKRGLSISTKHSIVLALILLALCIFFTSQNDSFSSVYNLMNIFRQGLPNILLACTMLFVIVSGGIDLSVSGVMALCAVIFGKLCVAGVPMLLAILIIIGVGMIIGLINTILSEKLGIPSIMATLATQIFTAGMALTVVSAIPISEPEIDPITILNSLKFDMFGEKIPVAFFIAIAAVLIFIILEKKTLLGKYAIAIGGNSNAAYFAGINVFKMRLVYFMISGGVAALCGLWQVARSGSADPMIGVGMEFSVIAAVILGGANIKGGEGTILGAVLGAIIMLILTNGMQMIGIDSFFQQVVTGVVLYVSVLVNSIVGSNAGKKRMKKAQVQQA